MDKQLQALHGHLEAAVQRTDADGIEFWLTRELQSLSNRKHVGGCDLAILIAADNGEV